MHAHGRAACTVGVDSSTSSLYGQRVEATSDPRGAGCLLFAITGYMHLLMNDDVHTCVHAMYKAQ